MVHEKKCAAVIDWYLYITTLGALRSHALDVNKQAFTREKNKIENSTLRYIPQNWQGLVVLKVIIASAIGYCVVVAQR
jgi:hypothetical protein